MNTHRFQFRVHRTTKTEAKSSFLVSPITDHNLQREKKKGKSTHGFAGDGHVDYDLGAAIEVSGTGGLLALLDLRLGEHLGARHGRTTREDSGDEEEEQHERLHSGERGEIETIREIFREREREFWR